MWFFGDGLYFGFNFYVGDFGDCKILLLNFMIVNGSLKDEYGDIWWVYFLVLYKVFLVMVFVMMVYLSVLILLEVMELIGRVVEMNINICSSKIFFIKVFFIVLLCV